MKIKKVGIVGAGALGVMYGHHFNKVLGKENFCFIVDAGRKEKYEKEGLLYKGEKEDFTYLSQADAEEPLDLIIYTVKIGSLEAAMENAVPFTGDNTVIMSFMNGISSEEILGDKFGPEKIVYAVVQGMDTIKKGNTVNLLNVGNISLGEKSGEITERITAIQKVLDKVGLAWNMPEDILHHSWSKLMLNTGVNQVLAVKNKDYSFIHTDEESRKLMRDAMIEVQTLAKEEGINIKDSEIDKWFEIIDSLRPDGMPSMVQDVRAGRKTEVALFSGTVKKLGKKHNIPTPVNDYLYDEIMKIEKNFR
ncbi:MAG: ketopantoate reductase family protein [Clostridiaceae bacterium]